MHYSGLTCLLVMVPSARTTGVEIFNTENFAHDHKWTIQVLGMKNIGVE
jgi:hypothetical protein